MVREGSGLARGRARGRRQICNGINLTFYIETTVVLECIRFAGGPTRFLRRHRGAFLKSEFALPSCSSGVWLVSGAVAAAIAAAVQQHAMKMATGIHPKGPATTMLWLIAGVNPAARKPKFVAIAIPEYRTRVSNISPKKDGQSAHVAA